MRDYIKSVHAIWQCKYHIAFCPKYRFKILKGKVAESVKVFITQLCGWKKLEILEMNVQEDHVHLMLSIPLKNSVAEVVGFLKEKCAIKMFDRHFK